MQFPKVGDIWAYKLEVYGKDSHHYLILEKWNKSKFKSDNFYHTLYLGPNTGHNESPYVDRHITSKDWTKVA